MHNLLIFGTGRSGTSMVAALFRNSGAYLGDNHILPNRANPYGFWEDSVIELMNNRLLEEMLRYPLRRTWRRIVNRLPERVSPPIHRDKRAFWLAAPYRLRRCEIPAAVRQPMLERFRRTPFCYKDPRFSMTLPLWRPYLPADTRFVVVFRSPWKTVDSMLREVHENYNPPLPLSERHAYLHWARSYSRLLHSFAREGAWLFIDYDDVVSQSAIAAIESFTDARVDTSSLDPSVSRASGDRQPVTRLDRTCSRLYDALRLRARQDLARWGQRLGSRHRSAHAERVILRRSPETSMQRDSLTSVIIIFLNAEDYLQEAIDSVLAQTSENWELLLVDDGSTDAGTRIALAAAASNPGKIRYLEHPGHKNRGMSASRNLGIRNAKGAYIAFLDADDAWLPNKLERQIALLETHPEAGMIYGPAHIWHSGSRRPDPNLRDYIQPLGVKLDELIKPPSLLRVFLRNMAVTPSPSGIVVRRAVMEKIEGFEDSFRGLCEDQVFYAKISLETPVFVGSECWYKYRQHDNSCCYVVGAAGQKHAQLLTYFNWLATYLSAKQIDDGAIWRLVRRHIWSCRHPRLRRLWEIGKQPKKYLRSSVKSMARRALGEPTRLWLRTKLDNYRQG